MNSFRPLSFSEKKGAFPTSSHGSCPDLRLMGRARETPGVAQWASPMIHIELARTKAPRCHSGLPKLNCTGQCDSIPTSSHGCNHGRGMRSLANCLFVRGSLAFGRWPLHELHWRRKTSHRKPSTPACDSLLGNTHSTSPAPLRGHVS